MATDIGLAGLGVAFLLAVYATAASAWGGRRQRPTWVESARNAALAACAFLTVAVATVAYSLFAMDFSVAYVAEVSSEAMSPFLRLAALWGGQAGSLLFWAWIMSCFVAAVLLRKWERNRELMPYFISVTMLTTAFFIGVVVFISNPFARVWHVPGTEGVLTAVFRPPGAVLVALTDGNGLNPLLRHFGMIGHPPTAYLGLTGFIIPYAFAISALLTGQSRDEEWIRTSRRWTLVAWMFLSIGLVLGGRWAYDVLGWGGFWGWDPVENAMLLPWLTGTAFLHSVMITERRGMLKVWSVVLIILTYSLVLFGTFITRSGVISSVHAFGKTALGPAFFVFIGVTFLGSLWLLLHNLDALRTEHEIESLLSRESLFLLQNLLFLAIAFAVFLGTVFPLLSEVVTGTKITVGPPYFKKTTGPLFAALLLLMGVAPWVAWRKQAAKALGRAALLPVAGASLLAPVWGYTRGMHPGSWAVLWLVVFVVLAIALEFWKGIRTRMSNGDSAALASLRLIGRNRRRYGGYIIHLGVVMIGLGFIGEAYLQQETQRSLEPGETLTLGDYSLRFDGLRAYSGADRRDVVEAATTLFREGQPVGILRPRRDFFLVEQQPVTMPAVHSTLGRDVYVVLVGWEPTESGAATLKMQINPLVSWVWTGGLVLILGTLIAVWPDSARRRHAVSYLLRPWAVPLQEGAERGRP